MFVDNEDMGRGLWRLLRARAWPAVLLGLGALVPIATAVALMVLALLQQDEIEPSGSSGTVVPLLIIAAVIFLGVLVALLTIGLARGLLTETDGDDAWQRPGAFAHTGGEIGNPGAGAVFGGGFYGFIAALPVAISLAACAIVVWLPFVLLGMLAIELNEDAVQPAETVVALMVLGWVLGLIVTFVGQLVIPLAIETGRSPWNSITTGLRAFRDSWVQLTAWYIWYYIAAGAALMLALVPLLYVGLLVFGVTDTSSVALSDSFGGTYSDSSSSTPSTGLAIITGIGVVFGTTITWLLYGCSLHVIARRWQAYQAEEVRHGK